jgi:hypothetical protein
MKAATLAALSCVCVTGCALWGEPLPDPECGTLAIDSSAELLITADWLRHDARAKNAEAGVFSFSGQLRALRTTSTAFDATALWQLVGQAEPSAPAEAPFRLLALVNRTDLSEQLATETPAGEGRLVYTLTTGPGDATDSLAQSFTVIFEYSLGSARSPRDWAALFHGLAPLAAEERAPAAEALAEAFTARPNSATEPHLSQIRVNDARSGTSHLYELALDETGRLAPRALSKTPRPCSDCHAKSGPTHDVFQLAEATDGSVTLSPFLTDEELPRRAQVMRARLCEQ